MTTIIREHGRGSILGALVGDAAGATLEFLGREPGPAEVDSAMAMTGGGCWGTAPGQVTDDGEMAICLMHALAEADGFDVERVAQWYLRWLDSPPFDCGYTTGTGLTGGRGRQAGSIHEGMWAAAQASMSSKANGSLMRIAPLGVWGTRLSEDELVMAACADARLTHPNPTCQAAAAAYCAAIRHLVLHGSDAEGAFAAADRVVAQLQCTEVAEWLGDARANRTVGYSPQDGFVKYAFTHAFRHLLLETSYEDAIRETLAGGGDTDTNACIVGGLIGALCGESGVPEPMREAVLTCDTTIGQPRPGFLQASGVLEELLEAMVSRESSA